MTDQTLPTRPEFTAADFAMLGEGEVAFVRAIRSDDVKRLIPQAPDIPPGVNLFALISANGTPIMIADTRDAIAENAEENHLVTVTVH
jgi:hypothetical protein